MEKIKLVRVCLEDYEETQYDLMYETVNDFLSKCAFYRGFYFDSTECYTFSRDTSKPIRATGVYIPAHMIGAVLEIELAKEEAVRRGYVR